LPQRIAVRDAHLKELLTSERRPVEHEPLWAARLRLKVKGTPLQNEQRPQNVIAEPSYFNFVIEQRCVRRGAVCEDLRRHAGI
jgi:hypothetical protein